MALLPPLLLPFVERRNESGSLKVRGLAEFSTRGFVYICKRHTSLRNACTILAKEMTNGEIKLQNSGNFYDAIAQHHIQH
jgi:hypothetical protein